MHAQQRECEVREISARRRQGIEPRTRRLEYAARNPVELEERRDRDML